MCRQPSIDRRLFTSHESYNLSGLGPEDIMKVGMNLLLWTTEVGQEHHDLLRQIKDWGFDGVEVPIFKPDPDRYRDLGARLDDLGLDRTAVTVVPPEANPISPDARVRAGSEKYLKQILEMCSILGCDLLCGPLHSPVGGLVGRARTADEWQWGIDILGRVASSAEGAGVKLALEFLNRFECYFLNSAADTVDFIEQLGHPALGVLYDTFHAHIEEKEPSKAMKTAAPHLTHFHVSENDRSTPGEGQVVWDTTFATLREIDYDNWLVIEAFGQRLPDLAAATCIWRRLFPSEEHLARRGLEFVRERWAEWSL